MTPVKKASVNPSGAFQRSKVTPKPPIVKKTTSPSNQALSKEDIVKLIGELLRKEFARLGVYLEEDIPPIENRNEDISELRTDDDDAMDIDLVRLENAKDLLAMEGKVEGIDVQILADTNANISWLPKFLADELGLDIDTSRTNRINGVSGDGRTLGTAKDVLIELQTGCIIKEDLAIVNYPYREMGLSRPCLRRYNYDVLESREHIPLTCNGKNFFIPIVPDKIRNKEEREN